MSSISKFSCKKLFFLCRKLRVPLACFFLFSIKTEPDLEIAELEEMLELPDTDTRCLAARINSSFTSHTRSGAARHGHALHGCQDQQQLHLPHQVRSCRTRTVAAWLPLPVPTAASPPTTGQELQDKDGHALPGCQDQHQLHLSHQVRSCRTRTDAALLPLPGPTAA
jgi:hypothetical protein